MKSTVYLTKNALKTGYYHAITTILSGASKKAAKLQYDECVQLCKEMDSICQELCQIAKDNHYSVILVGTNGGCSYVPNTEKEKDHCIDVPCIVIPSDNLQASRQECIFYD